MRHWLLTGWRMAALWLALGPVVVLAGGSGINVIVVVNQNSPDSVQLGNLYSQLRGVPPDNFLRLTNWTGGRVQWTRLDFERLLQGPLLRLVQDRQLTNQ